jgi:hypothetical protein
MSTSARMPTVEPRCSFGARNLGNNKREILRRVAPQDDKVAT